MTINSEILVNTFTSGDQSNPCITSLPGGGYVVCWQSIFQDGSFLGVYAQQFDATGGKVGAETLLNTTTAGNQWQPTIAALPTGGYVASWQSPVAAGFGYDVYAQQFDSAGVKVGAETLVNTTPTQKNSDTPVVAALTGGGYVVSWASDNQDGDNTGIYAQRFNAAGAKVGAETLVNTTTAFGQEFPSISALQTGGYAISWTSRNQDGSDLGVYAQQFDAVGNKDGGEILVNTTTGGQQLFSSIAGRPEGGFVVSWQSYLQDGSEYGIYAQQFDASGTKLGVETLVNTTTLDTQINPSIAALPGGEYVVSWQSLNQDGSSYGIYAQLFDSTGAKVGAETLINTTTLTEQSNPSVAALSGGGYVVSWQSFNQDGSNFGVYSRIIDAAPSLSIAATSTTQGEGNSGSTPFTFTVTRTGDISATTTTEWAVTGSGGSGANPADFSGGLLPTGTVSFDPGDVSKAITINVAGDTVFEQDEGFTVTLSNPSGSATITTAAADGTINNDDAAVPINHDPIALADVVGVLRGELIAVDASHGVLINDGDPDTSDVLTVSSVNGSAGYVGVVLTGQYGNLTLQAAGNYTYSARANAVVPGNGVAEDVFSYTASDGHGGSASSTLSVTLYTSGQIYLQGTDGADILHAENRPTVLVGSNGDDNLFGGKAADALIGGSGNDILSGGGSADAFLFNAGFGQDVVLDFRPSQDVIQFGAGTFSSLGDLMAHMQQVGSDLIVTSITGDSIILQNVAASALHSNDFLFV